MAEACKNCHRPDCPTIPAGVSCDHGEPWTCEDCFHLSRQAREDCRAHAVRKPGAVPVERCKNCDRPDCPIPPLPPEPCTHDYRDGDDPAVCPECRPAFDEFWRAVTDCRAHAVDWRARALAAEERIAKVRALAEQLENDPESWWCARELLAVLDGGER